MKKIVSLILVVVMCLSFAACKKKTDDTEKKPKQTTTTTQKIPENVVNPLTGESDFNKKYFNTKPFAVMINNIQLAQAVQTGVGDADMVFETLAEGGITRLLAVYQDVSKVGQIGSVRSARISYAQLVSGLDAYYVHCGADNKYCSSSYRNSLGVVSFDLGSNASAAGKRISNGLASEHTLYTFGESLQKLAENKNNKIKDKAKDVYKFNDEDKPETFEDKAKNVAIKLSNVQTTHMRYNAEDKKYIRGNSSSNLCDYKSGDKEKFKNVLVLYTNIHELDDNYHVKTEFGSGEGYYFTEGTYKKIKWEKIQETSPLKFKNTDGSDLKLNAGNSYICIADTDYEASLNIETE